MTAIVLVDWLGRGGIAQTSQSWIAELRGAGATVQVVTRLGRELENSSEIDRPESSHSLVAHAQLCRRAAITLRRSRPDVVVIQNYVVPALEAQVHRAARRIGALVVFVVHDHRHHEWREGTHFGLASQLRNADHVIVHSTPVAEGLRSVRPTVLPLPMQLGLVELTGASAVQRPETGLLALQFGVLNRWYKGTEIFVRLANQGVEGWSFALAGVGAPPCTSAQRVDRFLSPGDLVSTVREADAVLLPYRSATQSGAVVLAQMCGTVAIASAVGGVTEQIDDGVNGLLVSPTGDLDEWRTHLERIRDVTLRNSLAEGGRRAVRAQHAAFRAGVLELTGMAAAPLA